MFYAPEILSRKSRTSLSLVYYLSTAGSLRRVCRKEILELDLDTVIEQIRSPERPFALRLYSYLLQGIARIWTFKMDFYISKTRGLISPRPRSVRVPKRLCHSTNTNLEVCEDWVSEVEDSGSSTDPHLERSGDDAGFRTDLQGSLASDLLCVERIKIDRKTETLSSGTVSKSGRVREVPIPYLIGCYAAEHFTRVKMSKALLDPQDNDVWYCRSIDDISAEDPRISSSLTHERDGICLHRTPLQSKALWFYNVLVAASRGEVTVLQEEPFGELVIRAVDGLQSSLISRTSLHAS